MEGKLGFGDGNKPREPRTATRAMGSSTALTQSAPSRPAGGNEPLNYFTAFQKQVAKKPVTAAQDRQDRILMAFGQSLNQARGRAPDPNYLTETVNGRHKLSEGILSAYAKSGQAPSKELQTVIDQLDTLAETANGLAAMDPKVRTRLQGSNGAASLSVIRERENFLMRQAADLSRAVVNEADRLNMGMLRAQAAAVNATKRSAALTDEAKAREADWKATLDSVPLDQLIAMRATGRINELGDIPPAYVSKNIGDRTSDETNVQSYVDTQLSRVMLGDMSIDPVKQIDMIATRMTEADMDVALAMAASPDFEAPLNEFGEPMIPLGPFGNVYPGIVQEAYLKVKERSSKLQGLDVPLSPAQVAAVEAKQSLFADNMDQDANRMAITMSAFGVRNPNVKNSPMVREYSLLQDEFRTKLFAAYDAGSPAEIEAAMEAAHTDYTTKAKALEDKILDAMPEHVRPAATEIMEYGAIISREAAERVFADGSVAPDLDMELANNSSLKGVSDFLDMASSSPTLLKSIDPERAAQAEQGGDASGTVNLAKLLTGANGDKADDLTANPRVAMTRDSNVRANARQIFGSELESIYWASSIAGQLLDAKDRYSQLPADPRLALANAGKIEAIDAALTAFFGSADVTLDSAEFSPSASALYRSVPLIRADRETRQEEYIIDSAGQQVTARVIDVGGMVASITTAQGLLAEAGVSDVDLRSVFNGLPDKRSIEVTIARGLPTGMTQQAVYNLIQDTSIGISTPAEYIRNLTTNAFMRFKDANRGLIADAMDAELSDVVSLEGVDAARQRYIDEQVRAAMLSAVPKGRSFASPMGGSINDSRVAEVKAKAQTEAASMTELELIARGYLAFGDEFDIFGKAIRQAGTNRDGN